MARLYLRTYDIEVEDSGASLLAPFELEEPGDLDGRRVWHLPCHLGGDSMVLARHDADVVGLNFSPEAVLAARRRAAATGLSERLRFVLSPIDRALENLEGPFDVVYASWGVLIWLSDLDEWARIVAALLVPGGSFYLAESHLYAEASRWPDWSYGGVVAHFSNEQGDYSDHDANFEHPEAWEWSHGLGEIVSALAGAGLHLEFLHEHPSSPGTSATSRAC